MNLDNCLMEKVVKWLASYIRLCCSYFLIFRYRVPRRKVLEEQRLEM